MARGWNSSVPWNSGQPKARDTSELPTDIGTWLHVAPDGAVTAYTGKVEFGQNARTSLTQAVAEELHIAPGSVEMVMGDTARTPRDIGTFGSLTTPVMFLHLRRAAAAARESLLELAARRWEVDGASLVAVEGRVGGGGAPGVPLPGWAVALPESCAEQLRTGDPAVIARVERGRCLVDLRCVPAESDADVERAVRAVLEGRP